MRRSLPLVVLLLVSIVTVLAAFAQSDEEKDEREIIRLEHELEDAYAHNDTDALKRLLPKDYVVVSRNGEVFTKGSHIAAYESKDYQNILNDFDKLRVRLYGDTAILTGIAHTKFNYKNEQIFDIRFHYMRVYIRRNGRWQPVTLQSGSEPS